MRRFLSFCTILLMLILLCSCSSNLVKPKLPVYFYYRTNTIPHGGQSSVITTEVRDAVEYTDNYFDLLKEYFDGPQTNNCISPFPSGTSLEELNFKNTTVQLVLSPHISNLSDSDFIIACACITKTATELLGVNTVQICTSDGSLNEREMIEFTTADFNYWDNN